jgi:hypothetical protein
MRNDEKRHGENGPSRPQERGKKPLKKPKNPLPKIAGACDWLAVEASPRWTNEERRRNLNIMFAAVKIGDTQSMLMVN